MSGIFSMLSGLGGGTGAVNPGAAQANGQNILLRAIGAAMRGESAQDFMKQLANEVPELRQVDTNNLMGSAEKLAQQKGVDLNRVKSQVDGAISSITTQ